MAVWCVLVRPGFFGLCLERPRSGTCSLSLGEKLRNAFGVITCKLHVNLRFSTLANVFFLPFRFQENLLLSGSGNWGNCVRYWPVLSGGSFRGVPGGKAVGQVEGLWCRMSFLARTAGLRCIHLFWICLCLSVLRIKFTVQKQMRSITQFYCFSLQSVLTFPLQPLGGDRDL